MDYGKASYQIISTWGKTKWIGVKPVTKLIVLGVKPSELGVKSVTNFISTWGEAKWTRVKPVTN